MDRADMERLERPVIGFVELRATKIAGRVLGMSACGPTAAELANEVGLAITSGLTVRDIARSIHSYPSHGYLLHRIALAMATSSVWGLLSACGPVGKLLGSTGRLSLQARLALNPQKLLAMKTARRHRNWEAEGCTNTVIVGNNDGVIHKLDLERGKVRLLSYREACSDEVLMQNTTFLVNNGTLSTRKESQQIPLPLDAEKLARWKQGEPE